MRSAAAIDFRGTTGTRPLAGCDEQTNRECLNAPFRLQQPHR
jgi:hypothetical protein